MCSGRSLVERDGRFGILPRCYQISGPQVQDGACRMVLGLVRGLRKGSVAHLACLDVSGLLERQLQA